MDFWSFIVGATVGYMVALIWGAVLLFVKKSEED
jgi:hypothetical protein